MNGMIVLSVNLTACRPEDSRVVMTKPIPLPNLTTKPVKPVPCAATLARAAALAAAASSSEEAWATTVAATGT